MSLKHGVINLYLLILLLSLSSCTKTIYETQIEYVLVKPSNALLEECKPFSEKEIKTNGDLLKAYYDLIFDYIVCANKVTMIKNFFVQYNNETQGNSL